MIHWPLPVDSSPLPSPAPFACLLWLPAPALPPSPVFRPPFCPPGDFLLTRTASPSILPTLPPVPTVASAAHAPHAHPICSSRAAAALLATATRRPPSFCAVGGAPVRASPLRVLPSARGASRASGTRCRPASPSASAGPASALRCCAPPTAGRAAPVTHAPPSTLVLPPVMRAELAHAPFSMALTPFLRARPLRPSLTAWSGRICIASALVRCPLVLPPGALRAVSLPAAAVLTARSL
ncbi:unnamed protein product [Closterium sp. Naga37s-1]|nr:unnamed protein product [Closterium sp. Naga37s-1]